MTHPTRELTDLIELACEDRLGVEDVEQLESLLLNNAANQQYYLDSMTAQALLERFAEGESMARGQRSAVSDSPTIKRKAESGKRKAEEETPHSSFLIPHSSLLTHHSRLRNWDRSLSRHRRGIGIAAGLAFVAALLGWAALTYLPGLAKNENRTADKVEFVAQLIHTADAEWKVATVEHPTTHESQEIATGVKLFPGQRLSLTKGLARIMFKSGAEVLLEGPVEFEVGSEKDCRLELGKLVARCATRRSEGFVVETPLAQVTDLGTEFSVELLGTGDVQVVVLTGTVDVASGGADGQRVRLTSAQSARVAATDYSITRHNQTDSNVLAALREQVKQNLADRASAYAQRVLALEPVAYWRMEGENGLQVANAASDAHHGDVRSADANYTPWVFGKFGSALRLRGSGDCAVVNDYPASTTGQLTVAAWVYAASRPQWAMIAANWGHPQKTGQFHFGLRANDGDLSAAITEADGKWLYVSEGAGAQFPLSRWQHVAFVADGEHVRLYRNATEVATAAYDGTLLAAPPSGLGIGCKLGDDGATPFGMYWHGSIDELVLLHRALTADEIQTLVHP